MELSAVVIYLVYAILYAMYACTFVAVAAIIGWIAYVYKCTEVYESNIYQRAFPEHGKHE